MKTNNKLYTLLLLFLGIFAWGCSEDNIDPRLEEIRNEAFDLVVVSDENPKVPVSFTASATDLERVNIIITPQGSDTKVAEGSLRNIRSNNLNRINMGVNFPDNEVAPSGLYTVSYTMVSKSGQESFGSYDINVINNLSPINCNFTQGLPSGKSVWVRVYVPNGETLPADDNTIYITGSFGTREGGSDWDGGGNSKFALTRLSPTCYEIPVKLESGDEFKLTRGNWGKQMTKGNGQDSDNTVYNGEETILLTAFNWKDLEIITPGEVLNIPSAAIKPGMLTVVADVESSIDVSEGDFYVVEKGATSTANGVKMTPFEGENKLAAAVAKKAGVEYVVVQGSAAVVGKNRYGFEQTGTWDGRTNPVRLSIGTFGSASFDLGNKIVIVGGATPAGWNPTGGQDFTRTAPGKYEITIRLNANEAFLLLPEYEEWGKKFGRASGSQTEGFLAAPGSGGDYFTSDLETGNYKIEIDFTVGDGTYKLTKL